MTALRLLRLLCRHIAPNKILLAANLGLLQLISLALLLQPLGFNVDIGRISAGVLRQVMPLHLGDFRHRAVEEIAVVGDHHHRSWVGANKPFEPLRRRDIQVVGRLVEQQQIRRFQQHPRESSHVFLPATQPRRRLLQILGAKAQTKQRSFHPRLDGIALASPKRFEQDAVALQVLTAALRLAQTGFQLGHFRLHVQQRPKRLTHFFVEREVAFQGHLLREVADFETPSPLDRATIWGHIATQDLEQRTFATAIRPNEADFMVGFKLQRHVLEDRYPGKGFGYVFSA